MRGTDGVRGWNGMGRITEFCKVFGGMCGITEVFGGICGMGDCRSPTAEDTGRLRGNGVARVKRASPPCPPLRLGGVEGWECVE